MHPRCGDQPLRMQRSVVHPAEHRPRPPPRHDASRSGRGRGLVGRAPARTGGRWSVGAGLGGVRHWPPPGPGRAAFRIRRGVLRPSSARLDPFKSAILRIGQPRPDEDARRSRPREPRAARVWQQRRRKLGRCPHRNPFSGPDGRGTLPTGGLRNSHRANRGRRDLDRPRDGRRRRDAELGLDGAPATIRGEHLRLRLLPGRRPGAAGRGIRRASTRAAAGTSRSRSTTTIRRAGIRRRSASPPSARTTSVTPSPPAPAPRCIPEPPTGAPPRGRRATMCQVMSAPVVPVSQGSPAVAGRELRGLRTLVADFPASLHLPRHAHEHPTLAVIVSGRFRKQLANGVQEAVPRSVIAEPAGERHANWFGPRGARVVLLQPLVLEEDGEVPWGTLFGRPRTTVDPWCGALARRIAEELASPDDLSLLALHGLTIELLVAAARGRRTGSGEAPSTVARAGRGAAPGPLRPSALHAPSRRGGRGASGSPGAGVPETPRVHRGDPCPQAPGGVGPGPARPPGSIHGRRRARGGFLRIRATSPGSSGRWSGFPRPGGGDSASLASGCRPRRRPRRCCRGPRRRARSAGGSRTGRTPCWRSRPRIRRASTGRAGGVSGCRSPATR